MATCGTITVEPAFDPSLVTASCDVEDPNITTGSIVDVNATVTNENDAAAAYTLTFDIGSAVTETVSGTVAGGDSETKWITIQLDSAGDYPVSVSVDASQA